MYLLKTSSCCSAQMLMTLTLMLSLLAFAPAVPAAEGDAKPAASAAPVDAEKALRERAEAYWTARMSRSMKLFDYYRPPEKGGPVKWSDVTEGRAQIRPEGYEIERVEVHGDWGVVHVRTKQAFQVDMPITIPEELRTLLLPERWELFEGTWYKVAVPRHAGIASSRTDPDPDPAPESEKGANE